MTAPKTIAKILKLKFLKIVDLRFCRSGALILSVKPFKNGARCPECGRRDRSFSTKSSSSSPPTDFAVTNCGQAQAETESDDGESVAGIPGRYRSRFGVPSKGTRCACPRTLTASR